MKQITSFVIRIIKNIDNKKIIQEVKKEVIKLAKKFPVL